MSFYITYGSSGRKTTSLVLSFKQASRKKQTEKPPGVLAKIGAAFSKTEYEPDPNKVLVEVLNGGSILTGGNSSRYARITTVLAFPFGFDDFQTLLLLSEKERSVLDLSSPEKIADLQGHPALIKRQGPMR